MALKVKAQEKLQKIGTYAGKYRNGDCYSPRSNELHGRVTMKKEKQCASPYFCIAVTMVVVILVKMMFYFAASRVTLVAAMRPETRISVRALPPKR